MRAFAAIYILFFLTLGTAVAEAQSGRTKTYSESNSSTEAGSRNKISEPAEATAKDSDVIRVNTELVTVPFRVTDKRGRPVTDIRADEIKIFEDGEEREIAYFSDTEQPFTVALVLDMSYSSVFKLKDIQSAAKRFIKQLRPEDKVTVIAFAEDTIVLCTVTGDRRVIDLAIEGAKIDSGTSLYSTLDEVLAGQFARVPGRKAIVLFSDGVDTTSKAATAASVSREISESDVLIFPLRYDTYDDVRKNRRDTAPIQYDEDDRPYRMETPPGKGERPEDYGFAKEFLTTIARDTGGRLYNVSSTTNLDDAFSKIAEELRKIYSLGYYPSSERPGGVAFEVKVRIYRPDLIIRARQRFLRR